MAPPTRFERALDEAREALRRGRVREATRHAWAAGIAASMSNDAPALRQVIELGGSIGSQASGAEADEVAQLVRYCRHAIDHPREVRTLGFRIGEPDEATKVCPECAETVKAAAKVCRFCGHRFDAQAP
jgi:hypothetical protein